MVNQKTKLCVLLLINQYSKREGIGLQELYDKTRAQINHKEINKSVVELGKEKLINVKSEGTVYFINKEGRKYLDKELNKFKEKDYLDFLEILPADIAHNYRLYNIENTLFWGVFGWLAFNLSLVLLRRGLIITSLIVLPFSLVSLGFSMSYFVRIMGFVFYRISNKFGIFSKRFRFFHENVWRKLNKVPFEKIGIFIVLHGVLAVIGFIGWTLIQNYPYEFKNFAYGMVITALLALVNRLFKKPVAKDSLGVNFPHSR